MLASRKLRSTIDTQSRHLIIVYVNCVDGYCTCETNITKLIIQFLWTFSLFFVFPRPLPGEQAESDRTCIFTTIFYLKDLFINTKSL